MPLLRNKFQPYFPDPDSPNNYQCGTERYCHPISLGDTIFTQFFQTPCGQNEIEDDTFSDYSIGADIILNGTFSSGANWTVGTGWTINAGKLNHISASTDVTYQVAVPFVVGDFYQITFDVVRTAGSFAIRFGQTVDSTSTASIDATGSYTLVLPFLDTGVVDDNLYFVPTSDFLGSIDNLVVKPITYANWNPNGSWILQDGLACHIDGTTGILEQSVANYIQVNGYYQIAVTVSGLVAGSVDVYISDSLVATVTANGDYLFYTSQTDLPSITGVVSFDPSSDFVGCISLPDLRELKNTHLAYVVDEDGNEYEISEYFSYYNQYVTLIFAFSDTELQYKCYTIKVVDACIVEGINLAYNGNFANGSDDWYGARTQIQYPSNQMEFIFQPDDGTDLITNGDFATGTFAGWTAGAGWSVVANKAVHTPGSTATLTQTVSMPVPASNTYQYWIWIQVSGRTAGSFTVQLAEKTMTTFNSNMQHLRYSKPVNNGSQSFIITPTTDFDGSIDDIKVYFNEPPADDIWISTPFNTNTSNPLMVAGNYEIVFDIVSLPTSSSVGAKLLGPSSFTYFSTVGTHTITVNNYVPGGQAVQFLGSFESGLNGIAGSIIIDNVIVRAIEPFEATYTSECLNYALDHPRSKMIRAYCDQPAFGFEFANTGFFLQERVVVRSLAPSYPTEALIQKSGNGNARVTYASVEKTWQLHTTFASETFHDAMAVMIRCDHFLLGDGETNGTEYIVLPDDYSPEWIPKFGLAPAQIVLRIKDGGEKFNRHI